MDSVLFNGWSNIVQTLIKGISIYFLLIVFLRISGKRSLSKLNAFDFVVTVALGSIFASTLTSSSLSLFRGTVAMVTLLVLQAILTKLSAKHESVSKVIKAAPTIFYY